MQLNKVYIKGFRNFKECTVNFNPHCLIIGANDVGKTNLIYALRILLDRGFSDYDFELKESDFCAYADAQEITIRAYFSNITEDCITSRLPGKISDEGNFVVQYTATLINGKTEYQFYCGKSDLAEDLNKIDSPFYRKYLNLKYIGSKRELWGYINKSKNDLLLRAKANRDEDIITADDALYEDICNKLKDVDESIPKLSYIKNATAQLNDELNKLSIHHKEQSIVFDTSTTDADRVISSVSVISKTGDKKMFIGGEGRINQIYLSLWASQNQPTDISNDVSIICIEEPEAYLHPHQQRKLASYLNNTLQGQVILTSHSPFIVGEFSPNSIIRLYKNELHHTLVASDGCSKIIADTFEDFGYRMSVIPAEAFFSDCVILIEGPSEEVFYKTLAKQLDINLDRLNISVLDVKGVGFDTYVAILNALGLYWVMRTDNDIMQIPHHKDAYRYAGIERGLNILENYVDVEKEDSATIETLRSKIHGLKDKNNIPEDVTDAANKLISILEKYSIYIASIDLEEDLYNSPIQDNLKKYYGEGLSADEIIDKMKEKKAVNMYAFLKKHKDCLSLLKDDPLTDPLIDAQDYIEDMYGAD